MIARGALLVLIVGIFSAGCASVAKTQSQKYAKLSSERTFETELPEVWRAIESVFSKYKIIERDPDEVTTLEWNDLKARELRTDWVIGRSRDKFVEFKVNGSPRKIYLQTRIKTTVRAERVLGGTHVQVGNTEEIEELHTDGTSAGWTEAEALDTSRNSEVLDKIKQSILSAPNS